MTMIGLFRNIIKRERKIWDIKNEYQHGDTHKHQKAFKEYLENL